MRTIFVRFYHPNDVMVFLLQMLTMRKLRSIASKLITMKMRALMAYAETPCTQWSTILDDDTDM